MDMRTSVRLVHGSSVEEVFNDALPFIFALLFLPQGLLIALKVTVYRAGGPEYKTISDPLVRETVLQYLSLAICLFPGFVFMLVTVILYGTTRSTGVLRVMTALGLQLTPACAELVITWIVEPPDEMKEALQGSYLPIAL